MSQPKKCKYCPAILFWAASAKSGKMVPLERKPIKIWIPTGDAARRDEQEPRVELKWGYVNHFETCPGADQARADAEAKRAIATAGRQGLSARRRG